MGGALVVLAAVRGLGAVSASARPAAHASRACASAINGKALAALWACGLVALTVFPAADAWGSPPALHLTAITSHKGFSDGGRVYNESETVYQSGRAVGHDSERCTMLSANRVDCTGSYSLPKGEVKFAGTVKVGNVSRVPITGGSSAYRGARGTVLTESNSASTRAKETLTFQWRRPAAMLPKLAAGLAAAREVSALAVNR